MLWDLGLWCVDSFLSSDIFLRKILILLTLSFLNGHYIFAYDGVMSA